MRARKLRKLAMQGNQTETDRPTTSMMQDADSVQAHERLSFLNRPSPASNARTTDVFVHGVYDHLIELVSLF